MKYDAVIFDFDYTLGDATEAIYAGFVHGLTAMGYPAPDREAAPCRLSERNGYFFVDDSIHAFTSSSVAEFISRPGAHVIEG